MEVADFSQAVYELLDIGRGKYRNVLIVGPANCGKTFMLKSLSLVFDCFNNPASSTFAWVGAEQAEVIVLNDFRWNSKLTEWSDLLNLLEGEPDHFATPKSHYAKDILLDKDTPIFAKYSEVPVHIKNGVLKKHETQMMCVRWKIFLSLTRYQETNKLM